MAETVLPSDVHVPANPLPVQEPVQLTDMAPLFVYPLPVPEIATATINDESPAS